MSVVTNSMEVVGYEPKSYQSGVTTRSMARRAAAHGTKKNRAGQRVFGGNLTNQAGISASSKSNGANGSKQLKRSRGQRGDFARPGPSGKQRKVNSPELPPSKRRKLRRLKTEQQEKTVSGAQSTVLTSLILIAADEDRKKKRQMEFCPDYAPEVMHNMFVKEAAWRESMVADYMKDVQQDITPRMRSILVDWMIEVHNKFKLRPETIYLTIDLLDRFLSTKSIRRSSLQLLGCTCMWVASKYHEIYTRAASHFVYISDNAFSVDSLLKMETELVMTLDFNLTVPTALTFADRFIEVYMFDLPSTYQKTLLSRMTQYLIERALMTYSLVGEFRSKMAAAALYTAIKRLNLGYWTQTIAKVTRYSEADLMKMSEQLKGILNSYVGRTPAGHSQHKAVVEKYGKEKRGKVSSIRERPSRRQRVRD